MEIKNGGGLRIKKLKIFIVPFIILAFCLSFLSPDKNAWAANSSLYFDGNTYVSVPSNDALQPTDQITVEAWAFAEPYSGSYRTIISKGYVSEDGVYSLRLERTNQGNRAGFEVKTTKESERAKVWSQQGMPNDEWFHVAGVYDGSQMFLYINGALAASISHTGTLIPNNINVNIGRNETKVKTEYWHGYIDEVRIWNTARTQEEIQWDMNHELSGNEPGLVAYWNMNEGDGTEVKDSAGNHNGTIHGNIDWRDGVPISSQPPLDAPKNIDATVISSNSVKLTWQANTEEDLAGYRVYRNNTKIADVTSTSYTDESVLPGTTYTYNLTAYNTSNQASSKSTPATVTTPPAAPTDVMAQATGKIVSLSWQGPGNPQYVVERSEDGTSYVQIAEVTEDSYTEAAPLFAASYYYRVAQKGQDGQISDFTEPIQVTTEPVPAPADLAATLDDETGQILLSWGQVQGVESYIVEKSTDNETWETLAVVTGTPIYADQDIQPNTDYFYRVRSDAGNNQISEPSPVAQITTPPAAPTNLQISASGKNVTLTWNASTGSTTYIVERSTDGIEFTEIAEVTETNHSDLVASWNTVYHYRVLAQNDAGTSEPSSTVQIKTAPAPPANLRAAVSHNTITLTWNASAGAESYSVQRSLSDGIWTELGETSSTSYKHENLGWGITFNYRVFALGTDGLKSDASAVVTATTEDVSAPTNLTATLEGTDATLSWQGAPNISRYIVERSIAGSDWEILIELQDVTTYTDVGLDLSNDYFYRIRSDGGNQVSEPSNIVRITTPPGAPTSLLSSVEGKRVTLTWVGSGTATYIVERSIDGETFEPVGETQEQTYEDSAPRWETSYFYRVKAQNSEGMTSKPSEQIEITTDIIPVPTNIKASVTNNTITLSWDTVTDILEYRIERSTNNIFWSELIDVTTTSHTDSDLEFETNYYYRVKSLDGDQVSDASDTISAQTWRKPAPLAPRLACSVDNTRVGISWNYQKGADGYRIYIDRKLVDELPGTRTSYSFEGEPGKSYQIKVEVYNTYGTASNTITARVSQFETPGAGTMVGDVAKNAAATAGCMGGLLALALAIKGAGPLIEAVRLFISG